MIMNYYLQSGEIKETTRCYSFQKKYLNKQYTHIDISYNLQQQYNHGN